MTAEMYEKRIFDLRKDLSDLTDKALQEGKPVNQKFYERQKELAKTWKNYQAWCKRHNEPFTLI